jgi:rSAM/selenodomain-associated transferase 1
METAALGIMCKAPRPGACKTRLAALLGSERAAGLSACFLRDVAAAIEGVPERLGRRGYGIYAPAGAETDLRALLPPSFQLVLQADADFGAVLLNATRHLLDAGHSCAVLVNADSPTLPPRLLVDALAALRRPGDRVVLGPAVDGGYCLIGLKAAHGRLFQDIPWSTPDVFRATRERAGEIALPEVVLPAWYDVDDAETFGYLEAELAGIPPPFASAGLVGGAAAATRAFLGAFRARQVGGTGPGLAESS